MKRGTKHPEKTSLLVCGMLIAGLLALGGCGGGDDDRDAVAAGRDAFMNETFGNETFFGDVVGLHTLLAGVSPNDVVPLGVQVDITRVPSEIVAVMIGDDTAAKQVALADPNTTLQLLKAGAVIGVKGFYASNAPEDLQPVRVGLTCALCHVTVSPTTFDLGTGNVQLPIGTPRFDGVPNTAMDAGAILALTPFAQQAGQATIDLLNSWGPGRFDIRALPDNVFDDGANNPTDIPPIWNFPDLEAQGYRFGWDGLFVGENALASQAEAVYDVVMHGNGAFGTASGTLTPALAVTPPQTLLDALAQAEAEQPGNDIDAATLLDIQTFMRSIAAPAPVAFDPVLAAEGQALFGGRANCVACHQSEDFTGPGTFTDITATAPTGDLAGGIKVPGLRGVGHTAPYFHDHSAATLDEAVARLVARGQQVPTDLSAAEQQALVEYLKSL